MVPASADAGPRQIPVNAGLLAMQAGPLWTPGQHAATAPCRGSCAPIAGAIRDTVTVAGLEV